LAEITFNDNQVGGDTLVSLQGTESTYHGIARGYASGDLTFQTDTWNGAPDPGEFSVSGTGFNALSEHHQYTWDHHNRLTSVEIGYVSESKHSQQYDYFYDAVGRLMGKEFLPASGKLAFQTFVWEGDREILRIQTENDRSPEFLVSRYFHGDAVDMVLAEEKYVYQGWTDPPIVGGGSRAYSIPGETLWYLADHLGSVRGVVDNDGVIRQQLSYDSFGNRVFDQNYSSTGTTISSTDKLAVDVLFGYTGRFWDADIDLQYNRARWYDPSQGRWISQDPIGFAAGDANLYRYVGNGPTTKLDPSGLIVMSDPFGIPVEFQREWRNFWGALIETFVGQNVNTEPGDATYFDKPGGIAGGFIRYFSLGLANALTEAPQERTYFSQAGMSASELCVGIFAPGYHVIHGESAAGEGRSRLAAVVELGLFAAGVNAARAQRIWVYRVEGAVNQRIIVSESGRVVITGDKTLWLNFGNLKRAENFLFKRLTNKNPMLDAQIKAFRVPRSFYEALQKSAVAEKDAKKIANIGKSILSNDCLKTKKPDQYGIRGLDLNYMKDLANRQRIKIKILK